MMNALCYSMLQMKIIVNFKTKTLSFSQLESEDTNEMVFCDGCDICVHQVSFP